MAMEFSEKLRELRKQSGMTQEQLAERLYVSRTAVSKWESGRGYPALDTLQQVAKVFSVTVDALLGGEEMITVAKADATERVKKSELRFFGIVDIFILTFLFIPFFSQIDGDRILSVPLIADGDLERWIMVTYCVLFSSLAALGVAELIVQRLCGQRQRFIVQVVSFAVHTLIILLLIMNREPYAAVFAFCLIAVKAAVMLKPFSAKK